MARFKDKPSTIIEKNQMESLVFGRSNSLKDFISENSYGKTVVSGTVHGWVTLQGNFTDYCAPNPAIAGGYQCRFYNGQGVSAPRIIINDAVSQVEASGVDFSGVKNIILITNGDDKSCGSTSFGTSGTGGISVATTKGLVHVQLMHATQNEMVNGNGTQSPRYILFHEFGHNLNILHAGSWSCGSKIVGQNLDDILADKTCTIDGYGDKSTVMGNGNTYQFSAANKEVAGMLSSSQIAIASSDGTYTLDQLEKSSSGYKAIKIPLGNGNFYSLEYRVPSGYDNGIKQGVYLRFQIPRYSEPLHSIATLLPLIGGSPMVLIKGGTFTDPYRGIRVEVLDTNARSASVKVSSVLGNTTAQPQEFISPSNIPPVSVGDTRPIKKGASNVKLLDFGLARVQGAPNQPIKVNRIKIMCNSCVGDVFTATRLYWNGTQIGATVVPVQRGTMKQLVMDFDVSGANVVIPASAVAWQSMITLNLVGDVLSSDIVFDTASHMITDNIEGDMQGTPVKSNWNAFSPTMVVVP